MAKKVTRSVEAPRPLGELRHFDETNLARLGLISAQERIAENYTSWKITFDANGHDGEMSCYSPSDVGGVPHGVDGDFVTALNTLYLEQGAPLDGFVHATAYQLIQRAGFEDTGTNYDRLKSSLRRLEQAKYVIGRAWRKRGEGPNGWVSVSFSYISQISQSTPEPRVLMRGTVLSIKLADPVAESIRNQYIHPLDIEFQISLKRPLARALYRLLSSRRHGEQEPHVTLAQFTVSVCDWARDCKLTEMETHRIKRNLQEAHEELVRRGFLQAVVYEGRGRSATITYVFGSQGEPEPADLVLAESAVVHSLLTYQVARSVAVRLVKDYGELHVTERLGMFESMVSSGYPVRQSAALLVDMVKDRDGKYLTPLSGTVSGAAPGAMTAPRVPAKGVRARSVAARTPVQEAEESEKEFQALSIEEQAARAAMTLKFILRGSGSEGMIARIQSAVLDGSLDGYDLIRQAGKAAAELNMQSFVEDLRLFAGRV